MAEIISEISIFQTFILATSFNALSKNKKRPALVETIPAGSRPRRKHSLLYHLFSPVHNSPDPQFLTCFSCVFRPQFAKPGVYRRRAAEVFQMNALTR